MERTFTPSAASCPAAGARCDTVTFFEPNIPVPGAFVFTNVSDQCRDYNGVEFQLNKRCSNKWMGLVSFAFNDTEVTAQVLELVRRSDLQGRERRRSTPRACPARPTRRSPAAAASTTSSTTPSGCSRRRGCTLPWDINVARFFQSRQGYPFPQAVRIASRANRGGLVDVLLEPLGDTRQHRPGTMPDFKVEKAFTFGTTRIIPSLDIFNIGNVNTVLARRRLQAAANANQISGIVAPRVLRSACASTGSHVSSPALAGRITNERPGCKARPFFFMRGLRFARFEA